ncbi:precorrin-4 C(11)-methyltransferase [Alkalihalobacterium chitinilyticum]|uniref:Precorrin-4 C(11)-methyltransferase n=1 Tax=Alkalihalobacterium chitinilyticum TaxID=2980103 RepID=A0ABT5V9M7_9BACI|nr:precorrin-4 C(11)-methyltransferase [Alkalihalobacterium chitinilyticum]MDE5412161.1 precorrin-4 C(11)-methyltransferase [Alkalihalobacterium chitinilyticum]
MLEAKVYIVGAGPGDPELITVKGQNILKQADVILYTDSLVNEQLMEVAKSDAQVLKSAGMNLEELVHCMITNVKQGRSVARVHTGDPSVYGAILEQMRYLKNADVDYEIIPGVSSVFAAAAAAQIELTVPELTQTVILTRAEGRTPMPEKERLRDLANHHSSTCLFLSTTLIKKVVREFLEAGWLETDPVVVVYRASWPDQKVVKTTLGQLDEAMRAEGIRKQAMVIISKAANEELLKEEGKYESKLYDKSFTHGFRKGESVNG